MSATVTPQPAVVEAASRPVDLRGFAAVLTLVPGVLWVGRLTRRHAPRLTAAALLLVVPGYLSLGWFASTDTLLWAGA